MAIPDPDADQEVEECLKFKEALLSETREELQRADTKASILLAASGIALSALLTTFSAGTWSPGKLAHHDARWLTWVAIVLALVAFGFIGAAVKPRLRKKDLEHSSLHYFGNVQAYWPSWFERRDRANKQRVRRNAFDKDLKSAATTENYDRRLDDQIYTLGHIAFRKYRFVSIGIWIFAASILTAALALLLEKY